MKLYPTQNLLPEKQIQTRRIKQIESELLHEGQYERYGDTFRVWKITTDGENEEEVLKYIKENVFNKDLPSSGEWSVNIRYGAEKARDAAYYFRGCYSLEKLDDGYKYTVREPYCD